MTQPAPTTGARPTLPAVIEKTDGRNGATLRLQVPASLAWFDGHFPGDPILPAVVQIDWVIHFGAELGFDPGRFQGMDRLKFRAVITPKTLLTLELQAADNSLRFSYKSAEGIHSSGFILFHPADESVARP